METKQLKVYSNTADVDVTKIPEYVWNNLAELFWDMFTRSKEAEQNDGKTVICEHGQACCY